MTLEEKYTEMMDRFRADACTAVDEAIHTIHCYIAPHLDTDTDANVSCQASQRQRPRSRPRLVKCLSRLMILTVTSPSSVTTSPNTGSALGHCRLLNPTGAATVRHTPTHIHRRLRSASRAYQGSKAGQAGRRAGKCQGASRSRSASFA